jgi:hypothetical protein
VEIEYRINKQAIENAVFKADYIDRISVGSEGCMYKVPAEKELIDLLYKAVANGKSFSLVLPKISEKFMMTALEKINKINEQKIPYTLIANDFGLLYACEKEGLLPQEVVIGRGVSRSFADCLWYEHILRDEDDYNKRTMIQNNMYDEDKKNVLNKFKVSGVECNMHINQEESYKNLFQLGYQVHVHYNYISVAFSRACQTARYHNVQAGNCKECCEKPINLTMNKIWTRDVTMKSREEQINRRIAELEPEFILHGNVLYRKSKEDADKLSLDYVSTIIFDSALITKEEMDKAAGNLMK